MFPYMTILSPVCLAVCLGLGGSVRCSVGSSRLSPQEALISLNQSLAVEPVPSRSSVVGRLSSAREGREDQERGSLLSDRDGRPLILLFFGLLVACAGALLA
jgi:hypothetical protein